MSDKPTPEAIAKALDHVRASHPQVTTVAFLAGQIWVFTDDYGDDPKFGPEIDTDVLDAALDAAYEDRGLPSIYRIEGPLP